MSSNSMTPYQQFIHLSKYARFRDDLGRRESWLETVERYTTFFEDHLRVNHNYSLDKAEISELSNAIHDMEVMPSMRAMMTAGEALRRDNIAGFNCSYTPIDRKEAFSEILYILMCGTGVGYSVERQNITQLPEVPGSFVPGDLIVVEDSKLGWATAFRQLINQLYQGRIPTWNTDKVRGPGARLITFGGRASGPAPLEALFRFVVTKFMEAKGRKFNSTETSDIVCMVGEITVAGGVRRSALICLSNLSDDRMRHYKSGDWRGQHPYRAMANVSFAATERPETGVFMDEWKALYDSKSGERGIFNRYASDNRVKSTGMRSSGYQWGTNPCGEIILRPREFCNLSEAVVRPHDDHRSLERKTRLATILGTMQSSLTNYNFIGSDWKHNSEEERLLGVSMTGVMSNTMFQSVSQSTKSMLNDLRMNTREVNKEWARKLGIEPSAAITCNKPSGTVSKLVCSPSGVHTGYNEYYMQSIRAPLLDPMTTFMMDAGVPWEPAIGKESTMVVFYFAVHEPGLNRHSLSAIEHMDIVQMFAENWTDHNPSSTISVKEIEWPEVGGWVWKNFDRVGGMTFLPSDESGHVYDQAPWQDLDKDSYDALVARSPKTLDWQKLADIEAGEDNVTGTRDLACVSGVCAMPDLAEV